MNVLWFCNTIAPRSSPGVAAPCVAAYITGPVIGHPWAFWARRFRCDQSLTPFPAIHPAVADAGAGQAGTKAIRAGDAEEPKVDGERGRAVRRTVIPPPSLSPAFTIRA